MHKLTDILFVKGPPPLRHQVSGVILSLKPHHGNYCIHSRAPEWIVESIKYTMESEDTAPIPD